MYTIVYNLIELNYWLDTVNKLLITTLIVNTNSSERFGVDNTQSINTYYL